MVSMISTGSAKPDGVMAMGPVGALGPMPPARRYVRAGDRDGGNVSLFAVVVLLGVLMMLGLIVDGGSRVAAMERADDVAREAARTGADAEIRAELSGDSGTGAATGRGAAERYLAACGLSGTVETSAGQVVVHDAVTWTPIFLSIIPGVHDLSVPGEGAARTEAPAGS